MRVLAAGGAGFMGLDTRALKEATDCAPGAPLEDALARFAQWFRSYRT